MHSRFVSGLCALAVPAMLGMQAVTLTDADLVFVDGPEQSAVASGTLIYSQPDGAGWQALFSRNAGQPGIELTLAAGTYEVTTWSIPADAMNPLRQVSQETIVVGDGDGGVEYGTEDLLALLASWGACPASGACPWDLTGSGSVDVDDLLILLANWAG